MTTVAQAGRPDPSPPRPSLAAEQQAAFDADSRHRRDGSSREEIEGDAARRGAIAAIGRFLA